MPGATTRIGPSRSTGKIDVPDTTGADGETLVANVPAGVLGVLPLDVAKPSDVRALGRSFQMFGRWLGVGPLGSEKRRRSPGALRHLASETVG